MPIKFSLLKWLIVGVIPLKATCNPIIVENTILEEGEIPRQTDPLPIIDNTKAYVPIDLTLLPALI